MIRILFTMLLGAAAAVGLSLRLARDAATLPRSARELVSELRTVDLETAEVLPVKATEATPPEEPAPEAQAHDEERPQEGPVDETPGDELSEVALTSPEPFVDVEPTDPLTGEEAEEQQVDVGAAASLVTASVDHDEWARLIRRMLAVYRRTLARE